jgi:nanoRNase/pAp phosphatase (c-di-AMP/oligoRNAs hydrolase)
LERDYGRLAEFVGCRVVVLGHHNADPDVIGAAQGVKELVTVLRPGSKVEIVLPDDVSSLSRSVASSLSIEISEAATLVDPDAFFVVDTGSLNQIGAYEQVLKKTKASIVFIDHHIHDQATAELSDLYLLEPGASSTSEIVYRIMRYHGVRPSMLTAKALLSGIVFDSRHFSIGGAETLRGAAELLDIVGDMGEVKGLLTSPMDYSEKVARLKAGQRAEVALYGRWAVVFSHLGSYQSSGARALVSLGADLAAVGGEEKGEVRVSLRSTNEFSVLTGVHLGDLASQLGAEFDGSGSGHPTAAGVNCSGSLGIFRKRFFEVVKCKLSQQQVL